MAWYQVRLQGRNCVLEWEGKPARMGFFTTRFVDASEPSEATREAIALVRKELAPRILNEAGDVPELEVEQAIEINVLPGGVTPPGAGYTWYPDQ